MEIVNNFIYIEVDMFPTTPIRYVALIKLKLKKSTRDLI